MTEDLHAEIERLRAKHAEMKAERDRLRRKVTKDSPLAPYQIELLKLQRHLEATKTPMIVVFEGRDAAGKGGTIKRFTEHLNPRAARVVALNKPTETERAP